MISRLHRLTALCLFLLAVSLFIGCQLNEDPIAESPAVDSEEYLEKGGGCPKGQDRTFDLATKNPSPINAHYAFYTAVPPFSTADCLCESTDYEITFQTLPPDNKIVVFDTEFEPRSFATFDVANGHRKMVIDSVETLPDKALTVYIKFKGQHSQVPVVEAGNGLCIVNDLDDYNLITDPNIIHNQPFKVKVATGLFPGDSIPKAFIPEAITY